MKIPYNYGDREFNITPYNTSIEKEILLLVSLEKYSFNNVLNLLGIENDILDNMSTDEKIALLYKFRSVSVGEEIAITYKCKECKIINETSLNIEELVSNGDGSFKCKELYKELNDDNIHEFIDENIDDMDLEEYDDIFKKVKRSITTFNFIKECKCIKCGSIRQFDISDELYVIENMSEDTLMNLYQTINDLVYFGHYSKLDIDSFLPFERTIMIGLLNKTKEELNK